MVVGVCPTSRDVVGGVCTTSRDVVGGVCTTSRPFCVSGSLVGSAGILSDVRSITPAGLEIPDLLSSPSSLLTDEEND